MASLASLAGRVKLLIIGLGLGLLYLLSLSPGQLGFGSGRGILKGRHFLVSLLGSVGVL